MSACRRWEKRRGGRAGTFQSLGRRRFNQSQPSYACLGGPGTSFSSPSLFRFKNEHFESRGGVGIQPYSLSRKQKVLEAAGLGAHRLGLPEGPGFVPCPAQPPCVLVASPASDLVTVGRYREPDWFAEPTKNYSLYTYRHIYIYACVYAYA